VNEFLEAVTNHAFMRHALLTGVLASVACGVMGSFVVVKRISYVAGGIAHCVLGGIGAALYLQRAHGWDALDPIYGALVAALAAAVVIGLVSLKARQRVDTVIGAVWAMGMATGILFISMTPGYTTDLMSYLFGNILMVTSRDLWLIGALDVIVLVTVALFHKQLLAVCFDGEFAGLRGVHVQRFYFLLLALTALTVVLLVSVVGIILVIALLTLPAAMANLFARRLWQMMLLATGISAVLTTSGLALSYGPDLPAGAVTILLTGAAYFLVALLRRR